MLEEIIPEQFTSKQPEAPKVTEPGLLEMPVGIESMLSDMGGDDKPAQPAPVPTPAVPAEKAVPIASDIPADGKFTTRERRKIYHHETTLEIPRGYLEIRAGACAGLEELESVILPDTIVKIGSGAFSDNASLKTVMIPLSVKEIAEDAFEGCDAITNVTMPMALEWIAPVLFGQNVVINWLEEESEEADSIGDGRYTRQLRKELYHGEPTLIIPEGITEIRPGACAGLETVTEVVLPSTLTKICSGAFSECVSLRVLDIPANVTELEEDAFEDCPSLRMVAIPSHLEKQARACFPEADLAILD